MRRKHIQVTECLRGGPCNDHCSCMHCCISVCSVCHAYEGSLTTDCPGEPVSYDRQQEVYTTDLDYTVELGWHASGVMMGERSVLFLRTLTPETQALARIAVSDLVRRRYMIPTALRQLADIDGELLGQPLAGIAAASWVTPEMIRTLTTKGRLGRPVHGQITITAEGRRILDETIVDLGLDVVSVAIPAESSIGGVA